MTKKQDTVTYWTTRGIYQKKYKGKKYYFKAGKGDPTKKGERAALGEWLALKQELESEAKSSPHEAQWQEYYDQCDTVLRYEVKFITDSAGIHANTAWSEREEASAAINNASDSKPQDRKAYAEIQEKLAEYGPKIKNRIEKEKSEDKSEVNSGFKSAKESFMAKKEADDISKNRYYTIGLYLDYFIDFCKDSGIRKVSGINGKLVQDYINFTKTAKPKSINGDNKDERISDVTVKTRLAVAKNFIDYCWKLELIQDRPRTIDDLAEVPVRKKKNTKIKVYTKEQIEAMLEDASPRQTLYILLGLNCGYTQSDISALEAEDLDLIAGVIDTTRKKTEAYEVRQRHMLWKSTIEAIKAGKKEGWIHSKGRLILNAKGEPLLQEKLTKKGTYSKNDSIRNSFNRVLARACVKGQFKMLRKTGATLLENQVLDSENKYVTSLYLAHSEKSTKRHYTDKDYLALDEPLMKMGKLLGLN